MLKWFLIVLDIIVAVWAFAVAVTVPMNQAMPPLVIGFALAFVAYWFWPGRREKAAEKKYHDKAYGDPTRAEDAVTKRYVDDGAGRDI